MRVAGRQVGRRPLVILGAGIGTEKAALDERQEGGVVGHAVRHVVRFRKGGDRTAFS